MKRQNCDMTMNYSMLVLACCVVFFTLANSGTAAKMGFSGDELGNWEKYILTEGSSRFFFSVSLLVISITAAKTGFPGGCKS